MAHLAAHVRTGLSLFAAIALGATLAGSPPAAAQTPSASPVASPEAEPLPEGPLGDQIGWVLGILNGAAVDEAEVATHFTPEFLKQAPASQVVPIFGQLAQMGPFTIEPGSMVTTEDFPPTNAQFVLAGKGGTRLAASVQVEPGSGLIAGLVFQPAEPRPQVTPVGTLQEPVPDHEVTFQSGADTIHGSLMVPDQPSGVAALIISGSGPADRNGNSAPYTAMNTNLNLATTLAEAGVISLRYDKLDSGATGMASQTDPASIGVDLFAQEARDAAAFLSEQPGVDPARIVLVGHSEGALFALLLAQEMAKAGTPAAAVILVSPLSIRYLDLVDAQVSAQLDAAAGGQLTSDAAEAGKAELAAIIAQLRETGTVPESIATPGLGTLFAPVNARFLSEIDALDPAEIAASLPPALPVLVLHGEKDEQVSAEQVGHLMAGFAEGGSAAATLVSLPNANHLLRIVEGEPNAALDYGNPDLPFSPEAVAAIDGFLEANGLMGT